MTEKNRDFAQLKPGVKVAFDDPQYYGRSVYLITERTYNHFDKQIPACTMMPISGFGKRRVGPNNWSSYAGYIITEQEDKY